MRHRRTTTPRIRVFHVDGKLYNNFQGVAPACLPNLSVRNVWRASALGCGEPLGGNISRTQLLHKRKQNPWNSNKVDARPYTTNESSTVLCGHSSVSMETLWWATWGHCASALGSCERLFDIPERLASSMRTHISCEPTWGKLA